MKVLMVSDAGSIHTMRWAASLKEAGVDIALFSITPYTGDFYEVNRISLHISDLFGYKKNNAQKGKITHLLSVFRSHFKAVMALKRVIRDEKPDILHAHYATSYGLVAALSGFHPLIVSVWGSDVYEFPHLSSLNRMTVKYLLGKADRVLSTSHAMAEEASRYCNCRIGITPFGVDTEVFRPLPRKGHDGIIFGTVKTLSGKYGIDILLRAYALLRKHMEEGTCESVKTGLVIAGDGPDRKDLEMLAESLGIDRETVFTGRIPHDGLPELYAGIDVAVFLSRAESFGVSAVEAMACGVPVIASDADGFREILAGGAGVTVPRENPEAAAAGMLRMALDADARSRLGKAGRERVSDRYEWKKHVGPMTGESLSGLKTGRKHGRS